MFGVQALGSYPIALAGTEEQQRRYLPPLAKGERIAAFALSEPNAGSDVSAISTALRDTNGYRLNGVKHFISNAGIAHTCGLCINTPGLTNGLSAFIVSQTLPGSPSEKAALLRLAPLGIGLRYCCATPQR
jgi:alkylation response protein AidB-like acyl-CoA dehydrogenase